MGAAYHFMGKAIPPHQLAIGTLGLLGLLVFQILLKAQSQKQSTSKQTTKTRKNSLKTT